MDSRYSQSTTKSQIKSIKNFWSKMVNQSGKVLYKKTDFLRKYTKRRNDNIDRATHDARPIPNPSLLSDHRVGNSNVIINLFHKKIITHKIQ